MKPKEKAIQLYNKFYDYADSNYGASKFEKNWHGNFLAGERKVRKQSAKQCALIAVDEIINSIVITDLTTAENQFIYWEEVKQEIENYE
jgi:hypothetical protein